MQGILAIIQDVPPAASSVDVGDLRPVLDRGTQVLPFTSTVQFSSNLNEAGFDWGNGETAHCNDEEECLVDCSTALTMLKR